MARTIPLQVVLVSLLIAISVTPSFAVFLDGTDESDTSYGAYFRLRHETWSNSADFNNDSNDSFDRDFFRLKTSLWYMEDYVNKYDFFIKMTNEARYLTHTENDSSPLDEDELVIDNLYVEATDLFGTPVSLKIGRQDFLLSHGEGFLIMDGTPLDGARTYYFNAAKANIEIGKTANLDLIYISNQQKDRYLPSIYAVDKKVINDSDETGIVVYGRVKAGENLGFEPYYIFKTEEADPYQTAKLGNTDAGGLSLNTIGARATAGPDEINVRGEFACQFGEYDDGTDRNGLGGYLFVVRRYKGEKWNSLWELGYVYLSGDDRTTPDEDEGFDPLFSRWPWLSELYTMTLVQERGFAYWTNLSWYRINITLALSGDTGLSFGYNYIAANEENGVAGETEIGHLPQIQLSHKFTDTMDGYIKVEHMIPGDYIAGDDQATFVRWQLQWKL